MAMIYCPECGNSVSDKASFCPKCGYPIARDSETTVFKIIREKKLYYCAMDYEVYLDNNLIGLLKNGETLAETVTSGTHNIKLKEKKDFKKVVFEKDLQIGAEGFVMVFSAGIRVKVKQKLNTSETSATRTRSTSQVQAANQAETQRAKSGKICPKCGGSMVIQNVVESRKSGCGTILLYILLACTILGLLIVIPLVLRKKTETVTYCVCQRCGFSKRI